MFEPEVFREQIYCIEESTCDIVGTFRRPSKCVPLVLSLRPCTRASDDHMQLTSSSMACCLEVRSVSFASICFVSASICMVRATAASSPPDAAALECKF